MGTVSQGAIIFVLTNNKVCACTLTEITFTRYVFLSFSVPARTKGICCSDSRNEVLQTVYDPAASGGWILGSRCLERVADSRCTSGMCTFGIQIWDTSPKPREFENTQNLKIECKTTLIQTNPLAGLFVWFVCFVFLSKLQALSIDNCYWVKL